MSAQTEERPDVVLVSMPFAQLPMPSIALALLKSTLAARGIRARVHHFTLEFAELIGVQLYSMIAVGFPANQAMAGEWVFSHLLPGNTPDDPDRYVREILENGDPDSLVGPVDPVSYIEGFVEGLTYSRGVAADFIRKCAEKVVAFGSPIIGFTSTFQQNVASLLVAREIKRIAPERFIVFGGANCEGTMGPQLLASYDWIDAVVCGEADWTFPELATRLLRGQTGEGIAGVHQRGVTNDKAAAVTMLTDMDGLPDCNFDDYFEQFRNGPLAEQVRPMVLFETSRGCWWGEKAHCTFCGLNGQTMEYRKKSPGRAIEELRSLTTRYPGCSICVVDNILDTSYFDTFVPALTAADLNADLFWEVKSNLTREQLVQLRGAGIRRIQPGVENFSNQVLRLMKKGVSGIQNIQLIKWCRELDIEPIWNILYGFPRESPDEYRRMAEFMPQLRHLTPPITGKQIRMDRFSPNFVLAEQMGFRGVRPCPAYKFVYRLDPEATYNMAYYFAYDYEDGRDVRSYVQPVQDAIDDWIGSYPSDEMFYVDDGAVMELFDYRAVARERHHVLEGLERAILLFCDRARAERAILDRFRDVAPAEEIRGAIRRLMESLALFEYDGSYLTLALSTQSYRPQRPLESYRVQEPVLAGSA
jgi:ribosomal peptide maturation radical SAM protein 1